MQSTDGTQTMAITDSTIAGNRAAWRGGGLQTLNSSVVALNRVTVADNVATAGPGGGVVDPESERSASRARSSRATRRRPAPNCAGAPTNLGRNVESGTECGFTNGQQNTTAGLAADADR